MDITLDIKSFNKYIEDVRQKEFPQYVTKLMTDAGEMFIKDARTKERPIGYFANGKPINPSSPSFYNWTTRLRNSIGYVVSYNGKVIKSDFDSYGISGEASAEGRRLGLQYATELAQQTQGYALICVAGADYGLNVEAYGYDVITGSVLTLTQEILKKW